MSDSTIDHGTSIDALSIEEIDRELVDINEKLETLPADEFASRVALHQRHLELKARAAELNADAGEQRTTEDLEAEVRSLDERISAIQHEFIDTPEQDGDGNITGPYERKRGPSKMNQEISEAAGATELIARREKLQKILSDRS